MDCYSCNYEGTRRGLGSHYGSKPDHRPNISKEQHEIITGLLMGDGHINRTSRTSCLRTEMINKNYLEYLDNKFPHIGLGVSRSRTAEEQSELHIETGFNENASSESYSDCYWWETMNHQGIDRYNDWYESGSKIFPSDITLTPTILKHWYVCDGTLNGNRLGIYLDNERENKDKIESYFTELISNDIYWDSQETHTAIWFNKEDSRKLLAYIGEPLPGFEYKWTERFK